MKVFTGVLCGTREEIRTYAPQTIFMFIRRTNKGPDAGEQQLESNEPLILIDDSACLGLPTA